MKKLLIVAWIALVGWSAGPLAAAPRAELVNDSLIVPVALTHAGDARLFVTSLAGRVVILENGQVRATPFLDISDRVSTVGGFGLWSVAFHPDYPATPHFFAHYAARETGDSVISRFTVSSENPNVALASTEAVMLRIPKAVQLHYGGQLAFGPDGFLYISTGDGTDGMVGPDPLCLSQSLESREGKLLRIDVYSGSEQAPFYAVPSDNPFPQSLAPEVWGLGLRNPWRFSFDRETGELWVSDVGENRQEEVTRLGVGTPGGTNFGWKIMEGTSCFGDLTGCSAPPACNSPRLTLPTVSYSHAGGRCSIIGGYVYRGSLVPSLYGRYLYADFCSGELWTADSSGASTLLPFTLNAPASFGEDAAGELYVLADNKLYRLSDPEVPAAGVIELASPNLTVAENAGAVTVEVRRVGQGEGEVGVTLQTQGGSATAGSDYQPVSTVLRWADGELGVRQVTVPILDDTEDEPNETVGLGLSSITGGAILGARAERQITLLDDDLCTSDGSQLCLNDARFRVTIDWQSRDDAGQGQAVVTTEDSGFFWFFGPDNPEVFVKILDACVEPFNRYWVFLAGLTNVATRVEVEDTSSGQVKVYQTALDQGFEAVRDTDAFATCP